MRDRTREICAMEAKPIAAFSLKTETHATADHELSEFWRKFDP
jgi:hypothetical protein